MSEHEDEQGDVCGETFEHDLVEIGTSYDETSCECRRCGAEIIESHGTVPDA